MKCSSQSSTFNLEDKEAHHESSHSCDEKPSLKSERNQQLVEVKNEEMEGNKEDGEMNECKSGEALVKSKNKEDEEESGGERLKRHRKEVAGRVWIPEIWGQEEMLKDWIDCSAFEANLFQHTIMSARSALAHQGRTPTFTIPNTC